MSRRRKRHFFPSAHRTTRKWVAMGERQLAGEPSKLPSQSWSEMFLKRKLEGFKKLAEAGGAAIRDRMRMVSLTRRILPPQQAIDVAVKLYQDFPLSTKP